jgi:hypothetical protein
MARRVKVKRVVPGPVCRVPDAALDGRRRRRKLDRYERLSLFSVEALPIRPSRS